MAGKIVRIGAGAGYGGDRLEPAIELMDKGELDYIIFECLAERTVALAQLERMENPAGGMNPLFRRRMDKILDAWQRRPLKIITNMGAANPRGAAEMAAEMAREKGISGLKLAFVTGDDVLPRIADCYAERTMETGRPLGEKQADIISANAYIGAAGIVRALQSGADIVITGRAADPSLVVGPLVHEFGIAWDDYEALGRATLCGHLLECAGQVTGGYFADPGRRDVPNPENLGFPIAEIGSDLNPVITKLPDAGGLVSRDTVKEQIIYELQDPASYFTPDVTADFSLVRVEEVGHDRVRVFGASGKAPNGKYKVSVGVRDCFIGEGQISYGGTNCVARARLAGEIVRHRLSVIGCAADELRIDLMGVNSLFGETDIAPAEVRLRVAARTRDSENAALIGQEVETLYTNGPAGGGGASQSVRRIVSVVSVLLDRAAVGVDVGEIRV